jgi:hypothetical protein
MKAHFKTIISVTVMGIAMAMANSSQAGGVTVVVSPPAPVVVTSVPDSYVWDGNEDVGVVGDQYYYLGPGNVWMVMDAPRLHRFQGWEKGHADWRTHATHNVSYRNMGHANRPQPMHNVPPQTRSGGSRPNPNQGPDHHGNSNNPPQ